MEEKEKYRRLYTLCCKVIKKQQELISEYEENDMRLN